MAYSYSNKKWTNMAVIEFGDNITIANDHASFRVARYTVVLQNPCTLLFFETGFHYVAQAGLKLTIFLFSLQLGLQVCAKFFHF
jgi:hypothetical protein